MSIRQMSRVWDDSPYDGKALLLHLAIADFANDDGLAFPSQTTLARKARASDEWVRQTIRRMEADGYLVLVTPSGGRGVTAQRRLEWPNSSGGSDPLIPQAGPRETPKSASALPLSDEQVEPSVENMAADAAAAEDRITMAWSSFWDRYPKSRRRQKAECEKLYRKAITAMNLTPGDPNPINTGLTRWLRYWSDAATQEQYVTTSIVWLRQHRWEDDPTLTGAGTLGATARSFRDQRTRIITDRDGPEGVISL